MAEPITPEGLGVLVERMLRERQRVFLALDGPSAAGKTTLAAQMSERFGWTVVHMDDFFLRPEQRTPERYAAPGGNVDYERFLAEVLTPLRAGEPAVYRPLDCKTLTFLDPVQTGPGRVILAEGAYACHPALWGSCDLHLYLPVEPQVQRQRILRRNGERAKMFFDRWIPLEQAYFTACGLPERCDYIVETA